MSPAPKILRKFVTPDVLQTYMEYLRSLETWDPTPDAYWDQRTVNLRQLPESLREDVLSLRSRMADAVRAEYQLVVGPLYSDICPFVRWPVGYELHPHADAANADGSEHPFYYRQWTAILYLNNDYEGGQVYFPTRDYAPDLQPGDLLLFVGDLDNLHGVRPVLSGVRYTLASFFTQDVRYHDGYRI